MDFNSNTLTGHHYLELYEISRNKYVIGNFQDGITVHKQQVRSLNIFDELIKAGKIKLNDPSFRIAVFGAGVSGLTFTAASLRLGLKVTLIEQEDQLIPLQAECDTRYLHPNLYDWPHQSSYINYTKLPLLNWEHDTARNVASKLKDQFKLIVSESNKSTLGKLYDPILGCKKIEKIQESDGRFKIDLVKGKDEYRSVLANLIIYATGFGKERGESGDYKTPSYWENDALNKINSSSKKYKSAVISGMGDGGLIDAFRCIVINFNYELIFKVMRSNNENYQYLLKELIDIQDNAHLSSKPNYYWEKFSEINGDYLKYIHDQLEAEEQYYKATKIYVNSKFKLEHSLNHTRVSLLNAFLAYIFLRFNKLTFLPGNIKSSTPRIDLINNVNLNKIIPSPYLFWDRRGTNRKNVFNSLGLKPVEKKHVLTELQTRQRLVKDIGVVAPRWTFRSFYKHFNQNAEFDFITEGTTSFFNEFTETLYTALSASNKVKHTFRLSIHRVVCIEKEIFYQQVTPYHGTDDFQNRNSVGRIFKSNQGNVGLSLASGKPTLIVRKDDKSLKEIVKKANLPKNYMDERIQSRKSFFTLPVMAPHPKYPDKTCANFILYIDSDTEKFFTKKVLESIKILTSNFIKKIEATFEKNRDSHSIEPTNFDPPIISTQNWIQLIKNPCWIDIEKDFKNFSISQFSTFSFAKGNNNF